MPKRKTTKRKSDYNPNRLNYLSQDGKYYCYVTTDEYGQTVTIKIEVTPELEEITFLLDQMDYESDLSDRYQNALLDPEFKASQTRAYDEGEYADFIETIPDSREEPETVSPMVEKVRKIVESEFTDDQKDLFFKRYGMGMQFEQIRQEEGRRSGKLPGPSAMNGRKNRMLNKVAKSLGVDPPKVRKK